MIVRSGMAPDLPKQISEILVSGHGDEHWIWEQYAWEGQREVGIRWFAASHVVMSAADINADFRLIHSGLGCYNIISAPASAFRPAEEY